MISYILTFLGGFVTAYAFVLIIAERFNRRMERENPDLAREIEDFIERGGDENRDEGRCPGGLPGRPILRPRVQSLFDHRKVDRADGLLSQNRPERPGWESHFQMESIQSEPMKKNQNQKTSAAQAAKILRRLEKGGTITQGQALFQYGCSRLAARIYDLRKAGHNITGQTVKIAGGKRIKRYSMN